MSLYIGDKEIRKDGDALNTNEGIRKRFRCKIGPKLDFVASGMKKGLIKLYLENEVIEWLQMIICY